MIFKLRDPYEWRRVFALVPHFLDGDRLVWLQFVERRRLHYSFPPEYEYRLPEDGALSRTRTGTP